MPSHISFDSESRPRTVGDKYSREVGEVGKALIVDDNPELLERAAHLFRLLGFEVLTAANGEIGLAMVKSQRNISLLFSDVVMPGISGVQLAEAAVALIPAIEVILVSSYPTLRAGVRASFYEFGFLNKPYNLTEISEVLDAER